MPSSPNMITLSRTALLHLFWSMCKVAEEFSRGGYHPPSFYAWFSPTRFCLLSFLHIQVVHAFVDGDGRQGVPRQCCMFLKVPVFSDRILMGFEARLNGLGGLARVSIFQGPSPNHIEATAVRSGPTNIFRLRVAERSSPPACTRLMTARSHEEFTFHHRLPRLSKDPQPGGLVRSDRECLKACTVPAGRLL